MEETDRSVWFVGDLDDPWVADLAAALPAGTRRFACPADIPENLPGGAEAPRVLVLHRSHLGALDAERLSRWLSRCSHRPRLILCIGPLVRYIDEERWAAQGLFDVLLSEATARDTIGRYVEPLDRAAPIERSQARSRTRVMVVSTNAELRRALADACELLGFGVNTARDWSGRNSLPPGPSIWDVPMLEADWPDILARRSHRGPLIALVGFADRRLVARARQAGASACLEIPFDVLDLGHVLRRVESGRSEPAHAVPPAPGSRRNRVRIWSPAEMSLEEAGEAPAFPV